METFIFIFGSGKYLTFWQMGVRAVVIFIIALGLIRIAGRRSFGLGAPLDNIIVLLLGSLLARPIVGASEFLPTVFASFVIVVLHRVFALAGVHSRVFGELTKGKRFTLFEANHFVEANMRYCGVCEDDIKQELRVRFGQDSFDHISHIFMEKNGIMSFILKE